MSKPYKYVDLTVTAAAADYLSPKHLPTKTDDFCCALPTDGHLFHWLFTMAPLQDQDLFAIDSSGSQAVRSRLQSKPNARAGVLKSTDVLTNHSSTPALVSAKHARQREKDAVGMSKSEVRRLKDLVKRKEKAGQGLHGLPDERPIKGSSAAFEPEQGKYDMWSAEGSQKVRNPLSLVAGGAYHMPVVDLHYNFFFCRRLRYLSRCAFLSHVQLR